jgi:PAS domain S-box-containing protein
MARRNAASGDSLGAYQETIRRAIWPPLIVAAALAILLVWQIVSLLQAAAWENHSDKVIAQALLVDKLAVDAETGERGYLVGGDPLFLQPYDISERDLPDAFATLQQLVADNPTQQTRVQALRKAFAQWDEVARQQMALRRQAGIGPAAPADLVQHFELRRGKARMDVLRKQFEAFTRSERQLSEQRTAATETAARATLATAGLITLIAGGTIGFTTRRQMRGLSDRYEAALGEEQKLRSQLTATLYGIGDAVLVTDSNGIISTMNPVAERLTGWTETDATGKNSQEVFDIRNETTREVVESPVDRVIREGLIVGLANHTVLRRRDGGEVPIDDSGAPVRDSDGKLVGVVLVFRDVTDRRRLDMRRETQLQDAEARAERETILNRVGSSARTYAGPEDIEVAALETLATALGADRCFLTVLDADRDLMLIRQQWHADGLPAIAERHGLSKITDRRAASEVFGMDGPLVATDIATAPWGAVTAAALAKLGIRSLVSVPYRSGRRVVGAFCVAMSAGVREWTPGEIALTEAVAQETRVAVDAVQERRRERTIAQQLQEALVPSIPPGAPGLALRGFYRAALDEAAVGGDFLDCFPIDESHTALVVADLAGKGLAAAAQVATVRNMLRYAVYANYSGSSTITGEGPCGASRRSDRPLMSAVTDLNRTLAGNELLYGFATLFVGVYDTKDCSLTYVNCGQEPGLIWRALSNGVEDLPPTGPVLGGFGESVFQEQTVSLVPGDVLALFTDGLTETGPNRRSLMGVDGVAALLSRYADTAVGRTDAIDVIVGGLVEGVDEYARGNVRRDDISLLVGVVQDGGARQQ